MLRPSDDSPPPPDEPEHAARKAPTPSAAVPPRKLRRVSELFSASGTRARMWGCCVMTGPPGRVGETVSVAGDYEVKIRTASADHEHSTGDPSSVGGLAARGSRARIW